MELKEPWDKADVDPDTAELKIPSPWPHYFRIYIHRLFSLIFLVVSSFCSSFQYVSVTSKSWEYSIIKADMSRGDTMPKWLICGKLKKISKQINGFWFIFLFIYRLSSGLLVRGITENIRQFLLRFFNRQSSLIRYKILVFCNLKICLAVPSGSHYYLMMHFGFG